MSVVAEQVGANSPMSEVLLAYPGAQRALFRKYHIGGCSSCGFQPTETLGQVCARNNNLNVDEVLAHIRSSHEQDAKVLISPKELASQLQQNTGIRLLDIRSREEYDAVKIEGSLLLSQPLMQEILGKWGPDASFVVIDHMGKTALDGAAYFLGHGCKNVRALRGGIDAWSQEVDASIPQYQLG
ncbi:MAG TPA: rhodanese-like domain-containing protein [Verrucomicrobiae bacterium]